MYIWLWFCICTQTELKMLCFNMFRLLVDFLVRYPSGYQARLVFSLVGWGVFWQRSSIIQIHVFVQWQGKCCIKRTKFVLAWKVFKYIHLLCSFLLFILGRIISNRFIQSKIAGFIYFFFQSKIFETSITTRQAIELIIQIGISRSNDNVITNRIQNISKPWFVTWFGLFVVFINWIYFFFKLSYIFTYEKDGIHNIIYSYTIESSQYAKPSPYIDSLRIMKILQFRESMNFK